MRIKTNLLIVTAATSAVMLTGCQYPNGDPNYTGTGALTGGALGAASGAVISGRNAGAGALIGGAIGALAGGIIGSGMDEQQREQLRAQAPQTYVRIDQGQPLGLADVKAMARAGVSDDVIISQIKHSRTVFHLSSADIIDLHSAGVSDRVIDFMINTQNTVAAAPATVVVQQPPPPPPPPEPVVVSPGPGYVWIGGEWEWNRGWYWRAGYWMFPPYPGAIWIGGGWHEGSRGWHHDRGHWRR
jgi:outer membrane lipoprotein SlyB